MNIEKQIEEVLAVMEKEFSKTFKENIHHGLWHSLDLIEKAKKLVFEIDKPNSIDWQVLTAAIYLHDVFAADFERHGEAAATFVGEKFSNHLMFTSEQIEKIKQAVNFHDKKLSKDHEQRIELGLEAKILHDADDLDAFGIKGVYRYFCAHIGRGISNQRGQEEILARIKERVLPNIKKRYQDLYFDESRQMAKNDLSITQMFFEKLIEENYSFSEIKGATGVFAFIYEHFKHAPWEIASEVKNHFVESNSDILVLGEVSFVKVYFKRLQSVYTNAQAEWVQENKDSWKASTKTGAMKDMLELIEMVI